MTHRIEILTDEAHAQTLAALHALSFDTAWPQADFVAHLSNDMDVVLGLYSGEGLAGFILVRVVIDQAEIITIAIAPDSRRNGFGAALVSAAEAEIGKRGADILFLDVAEDNPAAIALYKCQGYQGCGRRPGYYRRENGRVAALLMQKRI